jgi:hypothetical protein
MRPACGTLSTISKKIRVTKQAVLLIWNVAKRNFDDPNIKAFTAPPKEIGRCSGEWQKWDREAVCFEIQNLKANQRRTICEQFTVFIAMTTLLGNVQMTSSPH